MKKSELKQLIRECILEAGLNLSPRDLGFNMRATLNSVKPICQAADKASKEAFRINTLEAHDQAMQLNQKARSALESLRWAVGNKGEGIRNKVDKLSRRFRDQLAVHGNLITLALGLDYASPRIAKDFPPINTPTPKEFAKYVKDHDLRLSPEEKQRLGLRLSPKDKQRLGIR